MLSAYEDESGFRPENESDIMLRMRVLAGEIYRESVYAESIMRQMFPATATGEYLDAHAQQRGLSRKNGTCAGGIVAFTAAEEEHGDILIPAGTEVCTYDDMLRYVTEEDAVLDSESSFVLSRVTSVLPGRAYNAIPGRIRIIVTPVLGISSVVNTSTISGGTDDESDEELRARIVDSYRNVLNGANAAYYRAVAMSVDGVYDASAVGRVRGEGTVNVYASGKGSALSSAVIGSIQALLDEKRELNVDVRAVAATALNINLYIILTVREGYDFDTTAAAAETAVRAYINGLGIGHDLLLSNVGEVVYHIDGVADYKFVESYGSDRTVPLDRFAKANTILVRAD